MAKIKIHYINERDKIDEDDISFEWSFSEQSSSDEYSVKTLGEATVNNHH